MKCKHRGIFVLTLVVLLSLTLTACDFLQFPSIKKPNNTVPEETVKPDNKPDNKPEIEQEIEVAPHPTIKGGGHLVPENPKTEALPKLIFSRAYIHKENNYCRILAITNTSDTTIDLNKYKLGQKQNSEVTFVNDLPGIYLEKGATVYILNSDAYSTVWDMFPTIKNLPVVNTGETIPANTSMKSSMKLYPGNKTFEIIDIDNIKNLGNNSKGHKIYAWNTVDIISINGNMPTKGSAVIRLYEPSTTKDYGWRTLDQNSKVQTKIFDLHDNLVGGKYIAPSEPIGANSKGGGSILGPADPTDSENKKKQNTALGEPKYTGKEILTDEQHWTISRPAYTLSYNHDRNIPNWVSWHIDDSDTGHIKRPERVFKADPLIKDGWEPVDYYDYHYSSYGFDKGHMCPNADRNNNEQSQLDTFYMTNMVPQAGENNQKAWADLESDIREKYADNGMEVYVVSGPSLENGGSTLEKKTDPKHPGGSWDKIVSHHDNGTTVTIDVPAYTWKVMIAIPNGSDDLKRINDNPNIAEVYAVWMPNSDAKCKGQPYSKFKVSIDFVEQMTGYDFFPSLDDVVEEKLESRNSELNPVMNPVFRYANKKLQEAV